LYKYLGGKGSTKPVVDSARWLIWAKLPVWVSMEKSEICFPPPIAGGINPNFSGAYSYIFHSASGIIVGLLPYCGKSVMSGIGTKLGSPSNISHCDQSIA
jgi:hypothetical protein